MVCDYCGKEGKLVRGLCVARCYRRFMKYGTPEKKRVPNQNPCSVCGTIPVDSRGLCHKHYMRFQRHGHTDDTRPEEWGSIEKHPLRHVWHWFKRRSGISGVSVSKEWMNSFLTFVSEVGERPSKRHRLTVIDPVIGYAKGNVFWEEHKILIPWSTEKKDRAKLYQREYRVKNPERVKNNSLRSSYGITMDAFEKILEQQNHKCAICGTDETFNDKNGRKSSFAVDHCHDTGKIRGLLCHRCNTGLGCFKESEDRLSAALEYLQKQK